MKCLIHRPLDKGRVYRHHGLKPPGSKPSGESDGMLLGNAHIEETVRKSFLESRKSRTLLHGGGNSRHPAVPLPRLQEGRAKSLGKGGPGRRGNAAYPGRNAVVAPRIILGKTVPLALPGDHMDHHRLVEVPGILNHGAKLLNIMTFNRPHIFKAQIHKEVIGVENRLHRPLEPDHGLEKSVPDKRNLLGRGVKSPTETLVFSFHRKTA